MNSDPTGRKAAETKRFNAAAADDEAASPVDCAHIRGWMDAAWRQLRCSQWLRARLLGTSVAPFEGAVSTAVAPSSLLLQLQSLKPVKYAKPRF